MRACRAHNRSNVTPRLPPCRTHKNKQKRGINTAVCCRTQNAASCRSRATNMRAMHATQTQRTRKPLYSAQSCRRAQKASFSKCAKVPMRQNMVSVRVKAGRQVQNVVMAVAGGGKGTARISRGVVRRAQQRQNKIHKKQQREEYGTRARAGRQVKAVKKWYAKRRSKRRAKR